MKLVIPLHKGGIVVEATSNSSYNDEIIIGGQRFTIENGKYSDILPNSALVLHPSGAFIVVKDTFYKLV